MIKYLIHSAILWYINRVGGAFHTNVYGPEGCYIVAMSDVEYDSFKANLITIRAIELSKDLGTSSVGDRDF